MKTRLACLFCLIFCLTACGTSSVQQKTVGVAAVGAGLGALAAGTPGALVGGALGAGAGYLAGQPADKSSYRGVKTIHVGETTTVVLWTDFLFEPGSSILNVRYTPVLDELVAMGKYTGKARIDILAYTDNVGAEAANRSTAADLAQQVSSYLWAHGIQLSRINVKGVGQAHTIASNQKMQGSAYNRRVEVIFQGARG